MKKLITILIPAYNEEMNLAELHRQLNRFTKNEIEPAKTTPEKIRVNIPDMRDYDWEFLFVNDGSRDNTLSVLKQMRASDSRICIVNLSRNFGKENAMLAGMDYAKGDAMVIIDADLQDPLDIIPEMIYWWNNGFDDVYGERVTRGNESWLRRRLSLTFYSLLQKTTKIEILPNVGDFRLLSRRAVLSIRQLRETQRYTKGLFCWIGYPKKAVLFNRGNRFDGRSSFNFKSLFNLAIEGITSFTTAPLRISTFLGFFVSLLSFMYVMWTFIKTIIWGDTVQGFPTLICSLMFIGGIQLISIGIIGEYIGRIFNETKARPPYIVEEYNDKKENSPE